MPPNVISANAKPRLVAIASKREVVTLDFELIVSIRPKIMQLVTIICTNKATRAYRGKVKASIKSVTTLVIDPTMRTNVGKR